MIMLCKYQNLKKLLFLKGVGAAVNDKKAY